MRFLTIWMLLFATSLSLAQQGGIVYGKTSIEHRGWQLTATISGVTAEGILFSGTNVQIGVATVAQDLHSYNAPDRWTNVTIISFGVSIGGEFVNNPSAPSDPVYSYGITFSSTHFPDGNNLIPIKLRVEFKGTPANSPNSEFEEIEVIVKFRAYNKGALLATSISIPDGSDPNLPSGGQGDAAIDACNKVGAQLEAMNHTVKPKGGIPPNFDGAQALVKADLLDLIAESTVYYACTHGYPTGVEDSLGTNVLWSEFQNRALANRTNNAPPYNLVFLVACETASAQGQFGSNAAAAFFSGEEPTWVDRAWVGFRVVVATGNGKSSVDNYSERVFLKLKEGYTIDDSLDKAGFLKSAGGATVKPKRLGDGTMTLTTAYKGAIGQWYRAYLP